MSDQNVTLTGPAYTPNADLPPLYPVPGPTRKMLVEIVVDPDFENRLDNQWMVEREIHADRWSWRWASNGEVSLSELKDAVRTFLTRHPLGHAKKCPRNFDLNSACDCGLSVLNEVIRGEQSAR